MFCHSPSFAFWSLSTRLHNRTHPEASPTLMLSGLRSCTATGMTCVCLRAPVLQPLAFPVSSDARLLQPTCTGLCPIVHLDGVKPGWDSSDPSMRHSRVLKPFSQLMTETRLPQCSFDFRTLPRLMLLLCSSPSRPISWSGDDLDKGRCRQSRSCTVSLSRKSTPATLYVTDEYSQDQ